MLQLVLALVALSAAVANADVCRAFEGKRLCAFSGTREKVKIPCKYNAVRRTVCGDWRVTITPGNVLDAARGNYVLRTLWVGVENIHDNTEWEGRSTIVIARKYLQGLKDEPFNKKDGVLETSDVFDYESGDNMVSLVEKHGQFRIDFGLYEEDGQRHKTSGFKFDCCDDTFEPTNYPDQLCGNGTEHEVFKNKKQNGFEGNRQATLIYNIFTNPGIIQVDSDCKSAARAMTNRCNGEDEQYKAAKLCWPILGRRKFYKHIVRTLQNPASTFRHCVEFVCSGFTDIDSCVALGDELDDGPTLPVVSNKGMDVCDQYLMTCDDPDPE